MLIIINHMIDNEVNHHCNDDILLSANIERAKLENVVFLLENNACANAAYNEPLNIAINLNNLDIVKCLVKYGAMIDDMAILHAAAGGKMKVLKYFIEDGFNTIDEALLFSVRCSQIEVFNYLADNLNIDTYHHLERMF